jgi:hypothetical protein
MRGLPGRLIRERDTRESDVLPHGLKGTTTFWIRFDVLKGEWMEHLASFERITHAPADLKRTRQQGLVTASIWEMSIPLYAYVIHTSLWVERSGVEGKFGLKGATISLWNFQKSCRFFTDSGRCPKSLGKSPCCWAGSDRVTGSAD